jgi:hypothetical protein
MKPETKLAIRKKTLMALRALIWHADEWLHARELKLRDDLASHAVPVKQSLPVTDSPAGVSTATVVAHSMGRRRVSFADWEARESGVAVISKKEARRRSSAADFDLRFG